MGKTSLLRVFTQGKPHVIFFTGQQTVAQHVASLPSSEADKLDMTSLLRQLLGKNIGIRVCAVSGGWCECDTQTDIEHYEQKIQDDNCWSHDWR